MKPRNIRGVIIEYESNNRTGIGATVTAEFPSSASPEIVRSRSYFLRVTGETFENTRKLTVVR